MPTDRQALQVQWDRLTEQDRVAWDQLTAALEQLHQAQARVDTAKAHAADVKRQLSAVGAQMWPERLHG